jgi:DNA-binding LytR/AlgR family response regulator
LIKCIIVEDELLAQQVIQAHLGNIHGFELVATCNNAIEAGRVLLTSEVDLIFLDIQLPGMTGLHFLRSLKNPPLVVLTTAYSEYALESYEFNVIDYLLKPISFERFSKAVNKIAEGRLFPNLQKSHVAAGHIFVKSNSKYFKVNFPEIIYVEAMKDYLKIHTAGYTLVTHQTMTEMEKTLPVGQFTRIHRSYIVALAYVTSIYGNSIEMGKTALPVGTNYRESVIQLIGKK